jgi:hypothetical protein
MPEKIIGRVTITGTEDQITKLTPFVKKATDLLDTRIDRFDLKVVPRSDMPVAYKKNDGTIVRAEGHWSDRRRLMRLADDLFRPIDEKERDKVLGHEFVHTLFSDWLGKWHRRQLLPLIKPPADNWNDMTIGDTYEGYVADPSEALACYGSAALFGWVKPAYASIYLRRIAQADYPKTKTLLLATAP